jgi:ribosomal protein S9
MQPMSMTENATNFDVVNVYGGGSTGQAEAKNGISTRYV